MTAHLTLLDDGIGVLRQSVSTLQRMLTEVLADVRDDLVAGGADALAPNLEDLRQRLDDEREDIDLLEEIESIAAAGSSHRTPLTISWSTKSQLTRNFADPSRD